MTHPQAGETVTLELMTLHPQIESGDQFVVEDWAVVVNPQMSTTIAGFIFMQRLGDRANFEAAVYGKVGPFGHIVLQEELGE